MAFVLSMSIGSPIKLTFAFLIVIPDSAETEQQRLPDWMAGGSRM